MSYLRSRRSLRVFVAFFLLFGAVITSWTVATIIALAQGEYLLGIPDVFGMNVYDRQAVQTTFTNATGTSFRAPTTKTYSVNFKMVRLWTLPSPVSTPMRAFPSCSFRRVITSTLEYGRPPSVSTPASWAGSSI